MYSLGKGGQIAREEMRMETKPENIFIKDQVKEKKTESKAIDVYLLYYPS